jgi:tetratricopeptide (TPR) repeat protein
VAEPNWEAPAWGDPVGEAPAWEMTAPPLADGFVPRAEATEAVTAALVPGAVVALVPDRFGGARGWRDTSGKTQLAVAAARSLTRDGAVEIVTWLTATSRTSVLSCYAEAAGRMAGQPGARSNGAGFGRAGGGGDAESVAARYVAWLRDTTRPWLVVLDDLTAEAITDERLWPAGPAGRVLITTADPDTLAGRPARLLPVGPFDRREALTYLIGRLTRDLDQRQGAIDLAGELDHEPLALAQASAVITDSELTCHGYREHFVRRRDQAMAASRGVPAIASITWGLSMDHADLLSPGIAQSVLVLAALLDGHAIPGTVFTTTAARDFCAYATAGGDAGKPEDGLAILTHAGLLSADARMAPPLISMSWPVQASVRAATPDALLKGAAVAAADAVLEAWPADDREGPLARALRSCTDSLRRAAGSLLWQGGCHALLLRAGHSLDAARLTGPAVAYWADLAANSAQLLGRDHPATSEINERLARAYLAAGRAAEAIPLLDAVWRARLARLGPDHPSTLEATRSLGQALLSADRPAEAITVLGEAAAGWERSQGTGSVPELVAREDLAAAHRAAGDFGMATALYRAVLTERERMQGARHADTMTTRQRLAESYLADGREKPAITQYERLVADRERVFGPDHLLTIAACGALGSAYHTAGRMASAVRLAERTRTEYTKVLGTGHPDTLAACVNLAHAYYGVGRITDATRLLTQTVERCEQNLPAFDPLTVTARSSLANISGSSA